MKINKKGFTLIEILVVVLIIGILAGIALPQYKKAVDRSTAAQGISVIKSVWQSIENYYLLHNDFPTSFNDLDVEIPWTGNDGPNLKGVTDTRSNGQWSLQLYSDNSSNKAIVITLISGKYTGGNFIIFKNHQTQSARKNTLLCSEWRTGTYKISKDGLFCKELFNGQLLTIGIRGIYTFQQ